MKRARSGREGQVRSCLVMEVGRRQSEAVPWRRTAYCTRPSIVPPTTRNTRKSRVCGNSQTASSSECLHRAYELETPGKLTNLRRSVHVHHSRSTRSFLHNHVPSLSVVLFISVFKADHDNGTFDSLFSYPPCYRYLSNPGFPRSSYLLNCFSFNLSSLTKS